MKKRLALVLPLAAVVIAVIVYLLAARPRLITNHGNPYEVDPDLTDSGTPVVVVFDSYDKIGGDYRLINIGTETVRCSDGFDLLCKKGGVWCKVKEDESRHANYFLELKPGRQEFFMRQWREGGKSLPGGEYQIVIPIKTDAGDIWITAYFVVR